MPRRMMQNKYRRSSSSKYERELVTLLIDRGVYAVRLGASGTGKNAVADVFCDGGILFEVKTISTTPAKGRGPSPFPYYTLTTADKEKIPEIEALREKCDLIFMWAIRDKSSSRKPIPQKWRFVPSYAVTRTSRGALRANPNLSGSETIDGIIDWVEISRGPLSPAAFLGKQVKENKFLGGRGPIGGDVEPRGGGCARPVQKRL